MSYEITKADSFDIEQAGRHAAKTVAIAKVAAVEIAKVGGHAIVVTADLAAGGVNVTNRLLEQGVRSAVFNDARDKIVQVTATNVMSVMATAQKEIAVTAASLMR